MTVLDLFSGIGGFTLAAGRVGARTVAFCEIDRFARKVLARHWPEVPIFDDIKELTAESLRRRGIGRVDCVTFGFPCQDVSVAGKRAGLAGDRTGLFWEAIRVVDAVRPDWILAENVPGLRSSNGGRDMGSVIGAFAERGYVGAWRSLDAQFFGLAQRRERVFFVAGLGARGRRAIQLVLESGKRYPAPSREKRQEVAAPIGGGSGSRGWCSDTERMTFIPQGAADSRALNAKGGSGRMDGERETFVFKQREGCEGGGKGILVSEERALALAPAPDQFLIARPLLGLPNSSHREDQETYIAFSSKDHGGDAESDLSPTLRAGVHHGSHANAGVPPAIAFGISNAPTPKFATETMPTLEAKQSGGGRMEVVAFCERGREQGRTLESQEELAYALTNPGSGGRTHSRQIQTGTQVRRLTPSECERLMGLPIGHTCLCGKNRGRSVDPEGEDPCSCADGPRYRVCGNSVAIPCVEWLFRCLVAAEEGETC